MRLAATLVLSSALALQSAAHAEPGHAFPPLSESERAAIQAAMPSRARATPVHPRRVLIFYRSDGWVHDSIPYGNFALQALGAASGAYQADLSEDLSVFSDTGLAAYDAVVFNNTTHLSPSPSQRAAILHFVGSGKGIAGIHAASDSFYTWPEGQLLLGGSFNSHPWVKDDTVAVKLDDPRSPLTAAFGGRGFWVKDEIYQIAGPYSRSRVHVLMSLDMSRPENARKPEQLARDDADFPVAWIRREGRGRVFYTSLGHNPQIYRTRELLQHYLDGIQFAIGDLHADATPSATLSPQPVPALAPLSPGVVVDEPVATH